MSRRTAFWLVLALVSLLMVPILSTIVFSLLDQDGVFGLIGTLDDRTGPKRLRARLDAASKKNERVASGLDLLGRSAPLLIACGRSCPASASRSTC